MEKFITASGTAIRISDSGYGHSGAIKNPQGSKPIIVLLHGYLESLDVWDEFSKLLTPYLRVIAADLPGHGISQVKGEIHTMEFLADVIKGALDSSGVERCVMAGHSMGGYAALAFLKKYPEMLDGLILVHSYPGPDSLEKKNNRNREIEFVRAGKKDLLAYSVENGFATQNRRRLASVIEELRDQAILTEEEGVLALLRGMGEREDSNEMLKESSVPQMFILGREDEYITSSVAQEMISLHPQARVVWLENSGHMGFIEEPEITAAAIVEFCREVSPESCCSAHEKH